MVFYRQELRPIRQAAWALRIQMSTLAGWNNIFNKNLQPIKKEDNRGKPTPIIPAVVRQVIELAKKKMSDDKSIRIESFTAEVNKQRNVKLSGNKVKEILIANDLFAADTRHKRTNFYKNLCRRIPNGLISIDGSELTVTIDKVPYKYNVELGVDVGSFAHTGFDIRATETAQAVIAVLEEHVSQHGCPLGIVVDHGSANLSEDVITWLTEHDIEIVPAGPANPKGNGTAEGAFSQLKDVIETIELDTSSPELLAKNVLEAMVTIYVIMRNKIPLRRNSVTPQEAMQVENSEDVRQQERERLIQHNLQRKNSGDEQVKLQALQHVLEEHQLEVDTPSCRRARTCIKHYSIRAIHAAEKAFSSFTFITLPGTV